MTASDSITSDQEVILNVPTAPPLPTAMPLDYAPPAGPAPVSAAGRWVRRVLFASGCAFVFAGMMYTRFPNREEVLGMLSVGLGLILLAVPLPDWCRM